RGEHVPRVRLAVQQLLASTAVGEQPPRGLEPVEEELPVLVREVRCGVALGKPPLDLCETIGEVRRAHVDLPQSAMKTFERVRVVTRWKLSRLRLFEVAPHGDLEAVTRDDAWFDAWIESSYRAVCVLREASRELDFS